MIWDTFYYTRLLRAPTNLALNTSRDVASTASLGNLCQCLTALTATNFFLASDLSLLSLSSNCSLADHRTVQVARNLCGSSTPTPLPKQGHLHLQHAAQDLVQGGFESLQRRRIHNFPGQPGPGLRHPQREEVLPHVQTELPLLQFVPIAPCPVTGHHWKESGPILLTPTLQIFIGIYKIPHPRCFGGCI